MASKHPERKAKPIPPITAITAKNRYESAKMKRSSPKNWNATAMIIENFLPYLSARRPVGISARAFEPTIMPQRELICI
jgi:hypothetical protein